MRETIIAGNWKMNKSPQESIEFIKSLHTKLSTQTQCKLIIAPPFTSLYSSSPYISAPLHLASQDISEHDSGAYTGDISADMLINCKCTHVIVGHSERRQYHNESSVRCNLKLKKALDSKLTPIYCIGETLEQRKSNATFDHISNQLTEGLNDINLEKTPCIIAYEPIWAIGTGKVATPDQAEEVHHFIRQFLSKRYSIETAHKTSILYGGSVKPSNIIPLINQSNIDGALVGGACIDVDSFIQIINHANKTVISST